MHLCVSMLENRKNTSRSIQGPDSGQRSGNRELLQLLQPIFVRSQQSASCLIPVSAIVLLCNNLEWGLTLLLDGSVFVIVGTGSRHG